MVDDARLAAAVMVAATAQHDGAITAEEQTWIVGQFRDVLGLSTQQAGELLAHARFIAKDADNLDNCFRRMAPVIKKACGQSEKAELIGMLQGVLAINPMSSEIERQAVEMLTRNLRT
jgi:uncharacterized tellurite resistance protein B-like protein